MRVNEMSIIESIQKLQEKFNHVDAFSVRKRVTSCTFKKCLPDQDATYSQLTLPVKKDDILFLGSTDYNELVTSGSR